MKKLTTYRIVTERLIIRCYHPYDAHMLYEATAKSIQHLLPWMPWAKYEPVDIDSQINKLREFRMKYDAGSDNIMGIFSKQETELLGGTGLHPRIGNNAMEIGYWVNAEHINQGIATEASRALVRVGFDVEQLDRIEIHCDPRNTLSANIPHKLGFTHEATLHNRATDVHGNPRDTMIWTMFREQYKQSMLSHFPVQAFDCANREIVLQ